MLSNQPIIRTRIIPPRRRDELVTRSRLIESLNELIEKRLLLISAPAGYGKTSLLVDFASRSPMPVCWYSIDPLDFDPQRFIAYFIAAIQRCFPAFGQRTSSVLSGEQAHFDGEYAAAVLINDLYEHVSEHFVLVLDDFHLINENKDLQKFISRFLLDVEENCHLIITSRTLLSLPVIPILAARSDIAGVSYEELAFLPDEIRTLYQQNKNQVLSHVDADEVCQRTEGWITGVVLASQVNQQDADNRARLTRTTGFDLEEYFNHVVRDLPEDIKSFLLWSSILEEFNAKLCQKVIEPALQLKPSPWQVWMDTIQRNNLFVMPVGEQGDWLRYHPLFLDFLQSFIHREHYAAALAIDHSFARVCIEDNDWDRAFSIYRRLDSSQKLVELVEMAGSDMVATNRISTLSSWLDSLPIDILNNRPYIVALQGYVAMILGDPSLALTLFKQAVDAMQLPDDRINLARTLSMRATLLRLMGQLDAAIADSNESMLLIGSNLQFRKIKGNALRCIGLCKFHQGKLQEGLSWLEKALNVMLTIHDQKNEAIIQMEIGLIHENLGNYGKAKEKYLSALSYWQEVENPVWLSNLLNNLGVLHQLLGDYKEASQSLEKALEHARSSGYARMEAFILTGIADIYAELQADEQSEQAYAVALEIANNTQEHFLQVYIHVQAASLAGHMGDMAKGSRHIEQANELAAASGAEFERHLCVLEHAGLKILDKSVEDILIMLEEACAFFEREGHKVQYEKAHLYLALSYQLVKRPEKIIEHMLHLFSSMEGRYRPATLIASAARYLHHLKACHIEYMQGELDRFLVTVVEFEENLPVLWRFLREQSRAVPFAPPKINIRAMGRMQIQINNHVVGSSDWQTQAARDMFFMLLAHFEGMKKEEISLILWPDASPEEAKFRFKNTVYRLRRAVGKEAVLLENDIYRFNYKLDYEYDVEVFLRENASANKTTDPMQKLSHFREAIKSYGGDYLSEIDETWVISPREHLRQNYLNILLEVSKIYFDLANYELALEFAQRALDEDNLLEDAHRQALKIFAAMGNRAALVRQYRRCVETLEKEINAPPSPQTQALYEELLR